MKKNLKKMVSLALVSVMALSLMACKGGSDSGTTTAVQAESEEAENEEAENGSEDVTIKFCRQDDNSRYEVVGGAVDVSIARYPSTKVEREHGTWTGREEKQSLAVRGGDTADVTQINWSWITSYSGNRTNFADLEDYGDVLSPTQFSQDSLDQCGADSKLMTMSVVLMGHLFYRNKTTLDGVGYEIPTDEVPLLGADAKFETYNEDYYPLAMTECDRTIFLAHYLESVYGKPQVENGRPRYMAEEVQAGMDLMTKLEETHMIPTIAIPQGDMADSLSKDTRVIDDKYASVFGWGSTVSRIQKIIAENTAKPGQGLVIGDFFKFGDYNDGSTKISMALAVSTNSVYPKETATLINYLLDGNGVVEICGAEHGIPCSTESIKVLEEKRVDDKLVMKTNAEVLTRSKSPPDPVFEHNDLKANPDGIYYKVFGKLSAGDITSVQATGNSMKGIDDRYNF